MRVPNMVWTGLTVLLPISIVAASEWQEIGPHGVEVIAIHNHPNDSNLVWAHSSRGIYRSDNGGKQWADCFVGGFSDSTAAFAVSPDNPDIMVVVGTGYKMYRSNNGCVSWNELRQAPVIAPGGRNSLTIPPNRPRVIVAADGQLFRSGDGGQEWDAIFSVPGDHFTMVVADPVRPGTLWVGGGSLYRSDDEGETWAEIPGVGGPGDMAFDPNDDEHMLVAAWDSASARDFLLKSTDGGASFVVASDLDTGSRYRSLRFDPLRPNTVWATIAAPQSSRDRLIKSEDGGLNWSEVTHRYITSAGLNDIVLVLSSERILVAQQHGVAASDDHGETWYPANIGFPNLNLPWAYLAPRVVPFDLGIRAVTISYPLHTSDEGQTWFRPNGEGDFSKAFRALLTVDPAEPTKVIAVTSGGGLHRSVDSGGSFSRISQLVAQSPIVIDYHGTTTWYVLKDGVPHRSADDGQTWVEVRSGLPIEDMFGVRGLLVDPWEPGGVLAVGGDNIIYISEDRGGSWQHLYTLVNSTNFEYPDVTFDPTTPRRIYCATQGDFGSEVHVTESRGLDWISYEPSDPFDLDYYPRVIAPDPLVPGLVYGYTSDSYMDFQNGAVLDYSGVVVSMDAGATWQPMIPAIEDERIGYVSELRVSPDGVFLYAVDGSLIFRLQLREPPPRRSGGRAAP